MTLTDDIDPQQTSRIYIERAGHLQSIEAEVYSDSLVVNLEMMAQDEPEWLYLVGPNMSCVIPVETITLLTVKHEDK